LGHGTARVEATAQRSKREQAWKALCTSFQPWLKSFALLILLTALTFFATWRRLASPLAQDRTLSLYNTHTHERLTVTYKRNGRFVQAGLNQLNRFLRDWRRDEVTRIDPDLFDVVWTVYREVGASEPIHVVSAYRSPATNNMLRRRSSGVARNSQHTQGRAMDFFIPGVSASEIRAAGLRLQQGGVGFYPRSATPFVHLDTGSVRMWPRMTRSQLSRVFPDGRTIHIPADGQPMPGFEQAQRDLQRGGGRSVLASASSNASSDQNDGDGDIVLPGESGGGFLQALFGGNTPEPEADVPSAPSADGGSQPARTTSPSRNRSSQRTARSIRRAIACAAALCQSRWHVGCAFHGCRPSGAITDTGADHRRHSACRPGHTASASRAWRGRARQRVCACPIRPGNSAVGATRHCSASPGGRNTRGSTGNANASRAATDQPRATNCAIGARARPDRRHHRGALCRTTRRPGQSDQDKLPKHSAPFPHSQLRQHSQPRLQHRPIPTSHCSPLPSRHSRR
jgi:uncharacterized protein YcbK (DUF882 family)